jgi:hypothetical protein
MGREVSPKQRAHLQRIAALGGEATKAKHGRWHYVAIGKAGKEATIAKHGVGFWKGMVERKRWTGPRTSELGRDLTCGEILATEGTPR